MMSEGRKFKTLIFYYRDFKQALPIAVSTSQAEIYSFVRIIFGIDQKRQLAFEDEEGNILPLPSELPHGTKIIVIELDHKTTIPKQVHEFEGERRQELKSNWTWKKDKGIVFRDEFTIDTFNVKNRLRTCAYGNILITSKKHYWRLRFQKTWCCQEAGITQRYLQPKFHMSHPEQYSETIGFPHTFPGESTGPINSDCSSLGWTNHVFLFFVDMEARVFIIINETLHRLIQEAKITFSPIIPYFISNRHRNIITLLQAKEGDLPSQWKALLPMQND